MRRVSITEAKNRLNALLEHVRAGETVIIEDRGVGIAVLAPLNGSGWDTDEDRIARLQRKGILRPPRNPGGGGIQRILTEPPPKIEGVLDELLEQRRTGR
jgi:prevent-host-death family protein